MTPAAYNELLRLARRHSRRADEAEDLVQDALLAAVAAGRDVDATSSRPWLAGVIRNRAAFAARGALRRTRRETQWQFAVPVMDAAAPAVSVDEVLRDLPPSLKSVAALAFTGHSRREIAYLLRLNDTALRQRLTGLKRQLAARGIELPAATPGLVHDLNYGRIRDALMAKLVHEGGLFASHDPDGHLFVIRSGARR
jgi:DNA-directed RNA polymerase specialized sigma24 family protein